MALHCAATLLLVSTGAAGDAAAEAVLEAQPAGTYGPWADDVDVVAEVEALADVHRGERVLVRLCSRQLAAVLAHLGRTSAPGGDADRLRLEVGDDGWSLTPWNSG